MNATKRIQIEATELLVDIEGVQCRTWNGVMEDGTPCVVFVHRIVVRDDDAKALAELKEMRPRRVQVLEGEL